MKRFLVLLILALMTINLASAIPPKISFQGVLKDASGGVVTANKNITFTIYDSASGGTNLWSETQTASVEAGLYTVELGSATPIPLTTFDGDTRYLGITVDGVELTPRVMMLSVPFAFNANKATYADTAGSSGGLVGGQSVLLGPQTEQTTSSANAVWVRSNSADGYDCGISAEAAGRWGKAVFGNATRTGNFFLTAPNYGGYFLAAGDSGTGVYGQANSEGTGVNRGGYFRAGGTAGRGVEGNAYNSTGINYGVYGTTSSTLGYGLYGSAEGGCGVFGKGGPAGGSFEATAVTGYGVYGKGYTGVRGQGSSYAVHGFCTDDDGYAGYFQGGRGVIVVTRDTTPEPAVAQGTIYFNTTTQHFYGRIGSEWKKLDN